MERMIRMRNVGRYGWIALALLMVTSLAMAQAETAGASVVTETDAAMAAQAVKEAQAYPLDYCLVTGEKLGGMGDPVVKTYNGREVRFCCSGCVKAFEKDKDKWMKKLDAAIVTSQKDSYPLQTCVVSGEKLGTMGDPVNYVYGNRLVEFCCSGCISTFNKEPGKYLSMLDVAAKAKAMPTAAPEKSQ
jgi:YHS domain-containing protein